MRNNRRVEFLRRGGAKVGKNKHLKNIEYIKECIQMKGGEAHTSEIYEWLNSNTRNGIMMSQLVNVMAKGPFIDIGTTRVESMMGGTYPVKVWRII